MALVRNEVNPLNLLGCRRLRFIPKHFSKIELHTTIYDDQNLHRWINYNLNSRYAIAEQIVLRDNKITPVVVIGFEDPKDLTQFTLGCPYIQQLMRN